MSVGDLRKLVSGFISPKHELSKPLQNIVFKCDNDFLASVTYHGVTGGIRRPFLNFSFVYLVMDITLMFCSGGTHQFVPFSQ